MTNKTDDFVNPDPLTPEPAQALTLWCASARMALVSVAGVVAAGLMATGLVGCADMSGISPQSSLRDAPSLGLKTAAIDSQAALS
ncbi:MAG: hypothetical protein Q7U14_00970, partial [Lacisediminimonas sp.]|nr:hypothetical protein [Lacisediminimonas sp.]